MTDMKELRSRKRLEVIERAKEYDRTLRFLWRNRGEAYTYDELKELGYSEVVAQTFVQLLLYPIAVEYEYFSGKLYYYASVNFAAISIYALIALSLYLVVLMVQKVIV